MKIEIEYTLSDEEILIIKKIFLMKNEPEAVKELKGFYTEGNGEPIFKEDFFNALKYSRPKTSIIIRFLLAMNIAKIQKIQIGKTRATRQTIKFNYKKVEEILNKINEKKQTD